MPASCSCGLRVLGCAPVVVVNWNLVQINALQAANIDGCRLVASGITALGVGTDTTGLAEMMLDHVAIEGVGAYVVGRGLELELVHRRKP